MPPSSRTKKTLALGAATLAYEVAGSGPCVLMIQGVGVAGCGWEPQVAALADRYRTIAFDNRGIGRSSPSDGPLTIERMAADALAIADAEGAERFHLVGHSMGGLIAQHLAVTVRPRVVSLALLCTFGSGKDGARMSPGMMIRALRTRVGTRAMRRSAMLELVMSNRSLQGADRAPMAAELGRTFGRDLADSPPILMQQLRAMSNYGATPGLAALADLPTLVVSGRQDLIARPALGRALADAIPGARYVEFPEAAHALPIESAREVNDLLQAHLDAARLAG